MFGGRGIEGLTQSAGGVGRGSRDDRRRLEQLVPTDRKLRECLRMQWNKPGRNMNRVVLRYIEEGSNKQYLVLGWNGNTTLCAMHEGKLHNLSLATLARRGVRKDRAWNPETYLGEVLKGAELPAPVLNENEPLPAGPKTCPVWSVCKGVRKNLDESTGVVTKQEIWNAYEDPNAIPFSMIPVETIQAADAISAVRLVQEMRANGTRPARERNKSYDSRTGGMENTAQMLGL